MTMEVNGEMKKTIKRIFAVVMAVCVIFAYSGVAMAKQQTTGTGQTMVHLHQLGGICDNKAQVEVTVKGVTYTATLNGSVLSFDMGTTENVLKPGDKLPFKVISGNTNYGKTGTIIVGKQEGNTDKEHDKGLNNYKATYSFYIPGKISISVTKSWDDDNNRDGIRPDSVTVELLEGGNPTGKTLELKKSESWTGKFKNLDDNKTYGVRETSTIDGYTLTSITGNAKDGFVITNSHTPATIDIEGVKTWDLDGKTVEIPGNITVNLLKNGNVYRSVEVKPDASDNWSYKFENVPKYENGSEIKYSVSEDPVTDFTASYDGFNIKNTYTPGVVSVSVKKQWDDNGNQDGLRPSSVTVSVYFEEVVAADDAADTEGASGSSVVKTYVGSLTLSADNNWTDKVDNLPAGKTYLVEEVYVPNGYTSDVSGSMEKGYTITNTHIPETVNIGVEKVWNDGSADHSGDSILINLFADEEEAGFVTLNPENFWNHVFENLPVYKDGNKIQYTVEEVSVEGYRTTIDKTVSTGSINFEVKNTLLTDISGEKTWDDNDNAANKRPDSITVKLIDNQSKAVVTTATATAANDWKYTFENVPKYNLDGSEAEYTVVEEPVPCYTPQYSGYNVKNIYHPEIEVKKVWNDGNNKYNKRPASITVELFEEGIETAITELVLNAGNGWAGKFTGLDKDKKYTVKEESVNGYESVSDKTADGYIFTNTLLTTVEGTKTWVHTGNEGTKPEEITVKVMNGESVAASKTVKGNPDEAWNFSFENLPAFDAEGNEITYTVSENAVKDYTLSYGDSAFNLVNTYNPSKEEEELPPTPPETEPPGPMGPTGPIVDPEGPEDIPSDEPGAGEGDGEIDVDPAGDTEVIDDVDKTDAETESKGVQTGDVTDMYLWLTIFGAALVSAAAVAGTARRREEK